MRLSLDILKNFRKPFDQRDHFQSFGEMRKAGYGHDISLRNAWNGVMAAFVTQPNFRIHFAAFIIANVLSYVLHIGILEYISIVVVSAIVFVCEMVNTAIEALGDEVADGNYKKFVGIAKDVSAGAVLISAFFAIIIGILVFGPKFYSLVF